MSEKNHSIKIPCTAMPFICETNRCAAGENEIHIDRVFSCHVAILLLKGSMEIIEDGIPYRLSAGDVFFLKGGVHHWGEKPFERGTVWYYAHFLCPEPDGDMRPYKPPQVTETDRVYLQGGDSRQYIELPKLLRQEDFSEAERLFRMLAAAHNRGDIPRASMLMWDIFLHCTEAESHPRDTSNVYAERIRDYIENHYQEEIPSEAVEKLCGISYKHICTVFRESTGMTIKKYVIGVRLKAACRMLAETSLSVTEIAEAVGFGDVYYFSRIFKRERGCSPVEYRKSYVPRI